MDVVVCHLGDKHMVQVGEACTLTALKQSVSEKTGIEADDFDLCGAEGDALTGEGMHALSSGDALTLTPSRGGMARAELQQRGVAVQATSLVTAAREGEAEVASLLLDAGVDPDTSRDVRRSVMVRGAPVFHNVTHSALTAAVNGRHCDVARKLLEHGASINSLPSDTLASALLTHDGRDIVNLLLEYHFPVSADVLIYAVQAGNEALLRSLIGAGAVLSSSSHAGLTPLRAAVRDGSEALCRVLLDGGAAAHDPDADKGRTSLMCAAAGGKAGICKMLVERGADVRHADKEGKTALHVAACSGGVEICRMLVECGGEVGAVDGDGHNPAWHAAHTSADERVAQFFASQQ